MELTAGSKGLESMIKNLKIAKDPNVGFQSNANEMKHVS